MLLATLLIVSCEREQRQYQLPPDQAKLRAPERTRTDENAYAVSQGKQLYRWMNCVGCHAMGGGGMGPAHMDANWTYGAEPQAIYDSIMNGRPNGMPAFRARITEDQAWQLVAYVRSMSALVSKDVAPGRNDGLSAVPPENMREKP
jgi:cytochrome c oxidase cbb3-type subunit 3